MNKAIQRIKNFCFPPRTNEQKKFNVVLDTDGDEDKVAELLKEFGEFETTRAKSRYCRYDVEGTQLNGTYARIEIKSRTYGNDFDTWIIDTYKMDWLAENHPKDKFYFVNVFEGEMHLYCGKFVRSCPRKTIYAKFKDGKNGPREVFMVPKDKFMIELSTGEKGKGFNKRQKFIK